MSSKLYRGGLAAETIAWNSVSPLPSVAGYVSPGGSGAFAGDPDQRVNAAYQKGLEDGRAAARQEIGGQLDAAYDRLARTIEELSGLRSRFRHEAEEDVVTLALAIARRVLHRELTMAPDALLGLVKVALEKIEAREVHRVRVRPEDAAMVQQHLEKMGLPRRVEVTGDPGLASGAAIFDSSRGALDVSVETQLAEIERGFADLVRRV
ncbi:MAG TPA: FliH/SctL family protein [Bryobacteraceae bacterium]|nr:FliH/SctL family protein [Bryobacteraceae bacterium]